MQDKQICVLIVFFFIARFLNAHINPRDTIAINGLVDSAETCTQKKNYGLAFSMFDRAEKKAVDINWSMGIFKIYSFKFSLLFNYLEKPDSAQYYVSKMEDLAVATKDSVVLRKAKRMEGACFERKTEYAKALTCFYEALAISEKLNIKKYIAADHHSIGLQKHYLMDVNAAIQEYKIAYEINKNLADTSAFLSNLYVMGNAYSVIGGHRPEAIKCHLDRLKICEFKKWDDCIYPGYEELSGIFSTDGNYKKAIEYAMMAYHYFKKTDSKASTANIIQKICSILHAMGREKEILPYLEEQKVLALASGDHAQIMSNNKSFALYYENTGDYKKAVQYYNRFIAQYDSAYKTDVARQMAEMSKKYETEKKDKELAIKESEIRKQEADAKQKSTQRDFFIAGFCVMGMLAFVILRSYNQKKKANEEIRAQKTIVDEKQKEILDSIRYARRIQSALIASESYIEKSLERLTGKSSQG
jgi:tetratricopeptide (TPR) repeat protein